MRLLLCEDETELSDALVALLKHNNYTVDAVYNGEDAVDYIETEVYDGIILDIMMPKKDGIQVLREIRAKGIKTPVIMLTAKSTVDDKVAGLDGGADDYLTKPFSMKELLARLRAMLRRKENDTSGTEEIAFGNIKLNMINFELTGPEGTLRLANKEFQMMEMLMTSKQIISADAFFDKIWGWDSDSDTNVVWVYISYLRKKLVGIGADVEINALRGRGYVLVEKDG